MQRPVQLSGRLHPVDNVLHPVGLPGLLPDALRGGVAPEALLPGAAAVLASLVPVQVGQDAVLLLPAQPAGGGGGQLVLATDQQVSRGRVAGSLVAAPPHRRVPLCVGGGGEEGQVSMLKGFGVSAGASSKVGAEKSTTEKKKRRR